MKKPAIILIAIAVIVLVGLSAFITRNNRVGSTPLNTTYDVVGQKYTLTNGRAEKKAPTSINSPLATPAKESIVTILGKPVYGDLNQDGVDDAVMFLTQTTDGSEIFYYVVEAINISGVYRGTNAMYLGDEIIPQKITIQGGRAVVDYLDKGLGKSILVHLDVKNFEIGELVKDFVD